MNETLQARAADTGLPAKIEELPPAAAQARLAAGALLLDLRDAAERAAGAPPGAVAVSASDCAAELARLAPEPAREILVLCTAGLRSLVVARELVAQGHARVASVAGGFARWCAEGLPVVDATVDADARERYARQLCLPEIGSAGQARLAAARVAMLGAGGLGAAAALYLAGAGVGHLTLIDDDRVERSNLQRQIQHAEARIGMGKAESARLAITALNPKVEVAARSERLTEANAERLLAGHDVLFDGSDNLAVRRVLSAASRRLAIPLVYGAVDDFGGQLSVFDPRRTDSPCLECLFPGTADDGDAPGCSAGGVFGVAPGTIGMLQAAETLKLILGIGEPLVGRLLLVDLRDMAMRSLRLPRNPACPSCGACVRPGGD